MQLVLSFRAQFLYKYVFVNRGRKTSFLIPSFLIPKE